MKTLNTIVLGLTLFVGLNGIAQTQNPDQNPNYKSSEDKYVAKADELNSTQSQTVQDTYEAFDWTEYKAEKKQDRKDRRYDIKKMRYQRNYRNYNNSYNNGYYNNGYNNGYNNNGYYNNGYNNGNYYNTPSCNSTNNAVNTLLLGSALYYLFN